jgi:uncharacterized protein YukE
MPKNNIIPQMFDIRPVNDTGDLDWEKIKKVEKELALEVEEIRNEIREIAPEMRESLQYTEEKIPEYFPKINYPHPPLETKVYRLGERYSGKNDPIFHKCSFIPRKTEIPKKPIAFEQPKRIEMLPKFTEPREAFKFLESENDFFETPKPIKLKKTKEKKQKPKGDFVFSDLFFPAKFSFNFNPKKTAFQFATISLFIALVIGTSAFGAKGLWIKGKVMGVSQNGYSDLNSAIGSIKDQNFEASELEFEKSYEKFSQASDDLDKMGEVFIEISRFFPFSSKLSSGKNLVEAGKHVAVAGKALNEIIKTANSIENPLGNDGDKSISFLEIFQSTQQEIKTVNKELQQIQENLDKINVDDLPDDKKQQFIAIKEKLPIISSATNDFLDNSGIFVDLLGGNGPRKYLFLFQNNQEMRPTGGFIGSYGLLDISEGRIRNFFIDGIFNPDGQLTEKIVPPKPIQKISAAWSLHDSNWFPNFPSSAEKAISFLEKTGGPTVDGVITLTPTVMQKLLEITGPIEMKDYDVTIDSENFIEKTQYEVEIDYDKEENKPKKILSDLAPIILDKIFNARDAKSISNTIKALSSGLSEKHVLLYSENKDIQKIISGKGWSGEILSAQKDYFSVINSNVNGYKTDGIIDESITHKAEIQKDGSIIDTITIKRHHNGGNSQYEWWNKVNADYLRVYVPLGSKLLGAEGQTRENNNPPLDYEALGFKKDSLVEQEESNVLIDENSGTRIYEDSGKTVFANWTYVSPQETMTLEYKYLLPFKISIDSEKNPADSYSLLAQKQSGSIGSNFSSSIEFPKNYKIEWNYPENLNSQSGEAKLETKLDVDRFIGLVFTKEGILND